jgi:hypothetical protein
VILLACSLALAEGDEAGAAEVVVEARRDAPVVAEHTLDRERVLLTPGTFEDAVRLVQSLPGVTLTPEYSPAAGDIAVRGADPRETRYLLDGIEIPYLYHFNGYSSVLPTRHLDELQLLPSTFGAEHGNATGGIVTASSTWQRPDAPRASANLNFVMVGAEAAVPSGEAWTIRASARRSYLDLVTRDDPQYSAFPVFADGFGRLEYAPRSDTRWALSLFGASDAYTRLAGEPELLDTYEQTINPSFEYRKQFGVAQLSHRHLIGANRLDGAVAATTYGIFGGLDGAKDQEDLLRVQGREDARLTLKPWLQLAVGAEGRFESLALVVETDRAWPELAKESALLVRGVSADETVERWMGGAYAEARLQAGRFRFVPGVRVDGDTLTGETTFDPRFNARWKIGEDEQLRIAVGQYSQFPDLVQLAPGVGDPLLAPSVSRQAALGFDYAIAHRWELAFDLYGKLAENLVETEPGAAPRAVDGQAWGAEVETRYRLRGLFFASASLALARSEHEGRTADYDQPWAVNVVGSWNFRPTWNVGLRYRASAGLPYTPIVDGVYLANDDSYAPVLGTANSERLPMFQKIDARVQKHWRFRTWSLALYGELWVVPPGSNVMYEAWSYDYDAVGDVSGPVFIPLLGARGEWGLPDSRREQVPGVGG